MEVRYSTDTTINGREQTCCWFLEKANLFNNFFAKQCASTSNNNTLPVNLNFETKDFHLSNFVLMILLRLLDL